MKTILKLLPCVCLVVLTFVSNGCSKDDPPPPRHFEVIMEAGGRHRSYVVNLPPDYYNGAKTYPMVIAMHGTGGNALQFESDYGFSEKADEAGFVAVYPNGVPSGGILNIRSWNAGTCCDIAMMNGVDDVGFISSMIDMMTGNYRIDPKRVYVTGMSNGGMMAYHLAAELPQKIAAIAPVASTMVYTPAAAQARAMPILHLHSALDSIVPYDGGTNQLGYHFPPVDSVLNVWALRNNCLPDAAVITDNAEYKQVHWTNTQGNELIVHYVTKDGGHAWPGGKQVRPRADVPSEVINANDLIWAFFQRYQLD